LKTLDLELNSTVEVYNKTSIFDTLSNKANLTLDNYETRANAYSELLSKGYKTITIDFFSDLDWLKNKIDSYEYTLCNKIHGIPSFNNEDNLRYKKLLSDMENIIKYYYKLDEDKIKIDESIALKYPKFVLDYFIYHQHWNRNWGNEKVVALDILRKYEFMGYTLINVLDCLEFDFYNPTQ
jgi:hypothetical protein